MPFREIKPKTNFVRISKTSITISISLVNNYFRDKRVKVFHDADEKLIGLKPDEEGYKISVSGGARRIACSKLCSIVTGEFYPEWSNEKYMLIFSY